MSFFKNLKGLFIIEEEKKARPKTEDPEVRVNTAASKNAVSADVDLKGEVSEHFVEILIAAMEKGNLQGFDYLEFKSTLKSLEKLIPDEPTRYRSAFASAVTMGVSAEKLLETANHYLQVLQKEEEKFEAALTNQQDLQINAREAEMAEIDKQIKEKSAKIKELTEGIEKHQKELQELNHQLGEAKQKIIKTKNDFEVSYHQIVDKIQADVQNIGKYLKS